MATALRHDAGFMRLYDENFEALRNYCIRRVPPGEVNDAVAEVFLIAWRRREDTPEGDEARLWLYGIARNVVRNLDRSLRRRVRLGTRLRQVAPEANPGPETQVVRRSEDDEILAALATLAPADREVLRLRVWEELSPSEAGTVLGITPHACAMRLSRAKRRLGRAFAHRSNAFPQTSSSREEVKRER